MAVRSCWPASNNRGRIGEPVIQKPVIDSSTNPFRSQRPVVNQQLSASTRRCASHHLAGHLHSPFGYFLGFTKPFNFLLIFGATRQNTPFAVTLQRNPRLADRLGIDQRQRAITDHSANICPPQEFGSRLCGGRFAVTRQTTSWRKIGRAGYFICPGMLTSTLHLNVTEDQRRLKTITRRQLNQDRRIANRKPQPMEQSRIGLGNPRHDSSRLSVFASHPACSSRMIGVSYRPRPSTAPTASRSCWGSVRNRPATTAAGATTTTPSSAPTTARSVDFSPIILPTL